MRDAVDFTEDDNRDDAMRMAVMLKHLYDIPALTVALVEDGAFGGGAGLAAACDMAIAVEGARFAFSEVRLGLVAATISPYVVAAIGSRRARRLFASAEVFNTEQAQAFGLVDEIVADSEALEAAKVRIGQAMVACAPGAIGESKKLVAHIVGRHIDDALLDHTARLIAAQRVSNEGQAGVRAFLEGRKAPWAE
jgi:methylglutaconyl-CoA hydratase